MKWAERALWERPLSLHTSQGRFPTVWPSLPSQKGSEARKGLSLQEGPGLQRAEMNCSARAAGRAVGSRVTFLVEKCLKL